MENSLERLLQSAATDVAARPDFYQTLLESNIFVIGRADEDAPIEEVFTAPEGSKLHIANFDKPDGSHYIPFFTSINSLQKVLQQETEYLSLPCKSFFELTTGSTLILNPGSDYGKEFLPSEVAALLEIGSNQRAQQRVIERATKVLLGQPKDQPQEMLNALSRLFEKRPEVESAYMCQMLDPSSESGPSLMIGIRMANESRLIYDQAGAVAAETSPRGIPVDFTLVSNNRDSISNYFLTQSEPFCIRSSKKGILRKIFGPRA